MKKVSLAIAGVTGAVGQKFLQVLEERNFPIDDLYLFASARSAGKEICFRGKKYIVEELKDDSFDRGIDFALFGLEEGTMTGRFAPLAAAAGCVVIDNSSFFRMKDGVPLVVPEVNPETIREHKGIIANPNCSTIQVVVALKPLFDAYGVKRVVYSSYQAVSGAGKAGRDDLERGLKGLPPEVFAHPIAGNCIPQIDSFNENGYTGEELKMINETRKILRAPDLPVTATCVRVPVVDGHCVSVNVELEKPFEIGDVIKLFESAPGVVVQNDDVNKSYPMPISAAGKDEVFIGRIRRDFSVENGLNLWVVADNTRKGAATNAVQIAEWMIENI